MHYNAHLFYHGTIHTYVYAYVCMYNHACAYSGFSSINQSSIIGLSGILGHSYVGAVMTGQVRGSHDPCYDIP